MKNADLPYYLTQFLGKYLPGEKNASQHTIQSYAFTFKLLLTFFEDVMAIKPERLSMDDLTRETITKFLDWLEDVRGCSISTRNQRLVAICSFVRFVQKRSPESLYELQKILNIPNKKCARTVVPFLTGEEMRILLSMPDPSERGGLRDMVLLALLYDSAARVQEIIDLRVKDLRLDKSAAVVVLHGKGQKMRHVPIMGKTRDLLLAYLERNPGNAGIDRGDEFVFLNQRSQQLSRWGVSHIIRKYVEAAKLVDGFSVSFAVTPHVFRHSKSVHLLQSGVNIIYIRDFLGHSDCSTTQIYSRADTETRRKAIEAAYVDILPTDELPEWTADRNLMGYLISLSR